MWIQSIFELWKLIVQTDWWPNQYKNMPIDSVGTKSATLVVPGK